jgi:tetratricopeptide (TPR) repeat protein
MTPSGADPAMLLAQADRLRLAGRGAEAERICCELLAAHPFAVPVLNLLAILLGARDELIEAEGLIRRALARAPGEPALSNTLGNLLFKGGDVAGAEAAYRQAIALKPDYAEAHYNHGLMLAQLSRLDDALVAQRRAVALKPTYAEALIQIGVLLRDRGSQNEALALFQQALSANPRHFDAMYYCALALISLQRHDEAVAPLQAALALRPQCPEALHALGNALGYINREEEALNAYRRAIEAAPGFVNAHLDYNALAWAMGRSDLHLQSFAWARSRTGDNPELLLAESEQRLRLDDPAAAGELLCRARKLAPERADIQNALGRTMTAQGDFAQAIALFETAAAAEPRNTAHYREMAIALLHDGKAAQALPVLERAHAVAPADQFILGLMTLAWRETGDARHAAMTDMDTYVRVYDLPPPPGFGDAAAFNRELAQELCRLHTHKTAPHDQTLRGGTQTMGHLFARSSRNIAALRERIDEAIADYIARMPDDLAHPLFGRKREAFSYFGSWSCRLRSSGFHTNHVHPQGWISSAYYVALPDEVADASARQGWIKFGESNLDLGVHDRALGAVQPAVGRLVLFPSYFWHGTVPFQSDQVRLTVAFDVVPGQSIG